MKVIPLFSVSPIFGIAVPSLPHACKHLNVSANIPHATFLKLQQYWRQLLRYCVTVHQAPLTFGCLNDDSGLLLVKLSLDSNLQDIGLSGESK